MGNQPQNFKDELTNLILKSGFVLVEEKQFNSFFEKYLCFEKVTKARLNIYFGKDSKILLLSQMLLQKNNEWSEHEIINGYELFAPQDFIDLLKRLNTTIGILGNFDI